MTIFRNPIEGASLPHPLACVDVDPVTGARVGDACARARSAHPKEQRRPFFKCPNRRGGGAGSCSTVTYLYPRRKAGGGRFHYHQGIDIFAKRGAPIWSVTNGVVIVASKVARDGFGGYGMVVVVESVGADQRPLYFLYAHCDDVLVGEGQTVSEKQAIATVGTTCFSKSKPGARFSDAEAHLHFEVSSKKYPFDGERVPGEPPKGPGRLDPHEVLEALGPWGMTKVYIPSGDELTRELASDLHPRVEASPHGGYFPLGANNHWHGGVHLRMPQGSDLVAPFDATIVAARLDPDPAHALAPDGSTNFILLRHEIPHTYHQLFQGKRPHEVEPPPAVTPKKRGVGPKSRYATTVAPTHRARGQRTIDRKNRIVSPAPARYPSRT